MSKEDQITAGVIAYWERPERNVEAYPEVHYNHYGSRGVVDLVVVIEQKPHEKDVEEYARDFNTPEDVAERVLGRKYTHVYEVKSESAIKGATGANEVLRQFNRHIEYFYQGSNFNAKHHGRYWLLIEYTDETYNHVVENWPLYKTIGGQEDVVLNWVSPESNRVYVKIGHNGEAKPKETIDECFDFR